ncbi:MAG: hypothetical protein U0Z53_30435 [Blastocatellia bacterium]
MPRKPIICTLLLLLGGCLLFADLIHSAPTALASAEPDRLAGFDEPGDVCATDAMVWRMAQEQADGGLRSDIPPTRYVTDPHPEFNGVAVDPQNNLVMMSDQNRKSLLVYDRTAGSLTARETTRPRQQIIGPQTGVGYVSGVAFDAGRRELYAINNDIEDRIVVFDYDDFGNARPKRFLYTPHQAWGIALNLERDELAVSVQQLGAIIVYKRGGARLDAPLRIIKGPQTGMADVHGIYWDVKNKELGTASHGNYSIITPYGGYETDSAPEQYKIGGHFQKPSLNIFSETADGDVKSLRTIQGDKTQLNWPMGISLDDTHNEIAVANNGDSSVLIFRRTDQGDVAPIRAIRGSRTGIAGPMGVAYDLKNDELWVANYADHTALVFARTANGNVAPKRIIRNAPQGAATGGFGNPYAAAYDPKREVILVPN